MYMKAYDLSEGGCMSFYASKNGRQIENCYFQSAGLCLHSIHKPDMHKSCAEMRSRMKKNISILIITAMLLSMAACGGKNRNQSGADTEAGEPGTETTDEASEPVTFVYGSGDYTRINPAMDEHGEINILLFGGLTAHDGENQVIPGLAESWEFDKIGRAHV